MLYEYCGLDWFPLIDGWWGHCCAAHDAAGLSPGSNIEFARCMARAGGPVLAAVGFALVSIGLIGQRIHRALRRR